MRARSTQVVIASNRLPQALEVALLTSASPRVSCSAVLPGDQELCEDEDSVDICKLMRRCSGWSGSLIRRVPSHSATSILAMSSSILAMSSGLW